MTKFCLNIVLFTQNDNLPHINTFLNKFGESIFKINLVLLFDPKTLKIDLDTLAKKHKIPFIKTVISHFTNYKNIIDSINSNIPDTTHIIVDYDQILEGDVDINELKNCSYYVSHIERTYQYSKLFIFNQNIDDSDQYMIFENSPPKISILDNINSYSTLESITKLIDKYNNVYENIIKHIDSPKTCDPEVIYWLYIKKDFEQIHQLLKYVDKDKYTWFINYMYCVCYFHFNNYKKSLEYSRICLSIDSRRIEPMYLMAKIQFTNNCFKECQNTLGKVNTKQFDKSGIHGIIDIDIFEFFIYLQAVLLHRNQRNTPKALSICEYVLLNYKYPPYRNILNSLYQSLIENYQLEIVINSEHIKKYDKIFTDSIDYLWFNNSSEEYFSKKDNDNNVNIHNNGDILKSYTNLDRYSFIVNDQITIVKFTDNGLYFNNIDEDKEWDHKIVSNEFKNMVPVSLYFDNGDNYTCLVKLMNTNVYKFLCINKTNFHVSYSEQFKITNLGTIKILILQEDILYFVFANKMVFSKQFSELCLDLKIPTKHNENVKLDIIDSIDIELDIIGYSNNIRKNRNLSIKQNSESVLKIDTNNNIFQYGNLDYNILVRDFIYLPGQEVDKEKLYTIAYHNKDSIDETLVKKLEEIEITSGDNYKHAKYLVINNYELEKLSTKTVSSIIENDTLIISLIKDFKKYQEDVNIYSDNKYLNKLYLFNIFQNDTYIEFMVDRIFSDDAYKQRNEFMTIDKENLLVNCGLVNTYFRYLDLVKKEKQNQETLLNKNEYKQYLIQRALTNNNNTYVVDIVRFLVANNQDVEILFNTEDIDPIIELMNIFAESINLNDLSNEQMGEIELTQRMLLVETFKDVEKYNHLCGESSIIYCKETDKIYNIL